MSNTTIIDTLTQYEQIVKDIKRKIYKPVYFLCGEESYFIEQLIKMFEEEILKPEEKFFNLINLEGKDIDIRTIIASCHRYPFFDNYQIVIVRNAQEIKELTKHTEDIDLLIKYIKNPFSSTILIIEYKKESLDKRTTLYKTLSQYGIYFESKKLNNKSLFKWIKNFFITNNVEIEDKHIDLIIEYLENDLTLISNELNKLLLYSKGSNKIDISIIESVIGVSKEYNSFELINALAKKNFNKAAKIINYFYKNPKDNPPEKILGIIFSFFNKLLIYKTYEKEPLNFIAEKIEVPVYYINDYKIASKLYTFKEIEKKISILNEFDLRIKGIIGFTQPQELFKELIAKLINESYN